MIKNINENELDKLNKSFINIDYLKNEFKNNPFARLLVLIEENEVIGFLYYSDIYDRIEINQFEINFIHRNCGKGSYFLKEFTENVEKDITLEVRKDNYPAIAVYKKVGFIEVAERKNYYNGIDGILMERKYDRAL